MLFNWMDKFLNEKELISLPDNQSDDSMAKKNPEDQIRELKAENKRLEKAIELEKLRAKAYDTMINIAEQTFNIPIRKNLAPNSKSAREECKGFALSLLCGLFGYSRQSYYKRDENEFAEDAIEPLIVEKA